MSGRAAKCRVGPEGGTMSEQGWAGVILAAALAAIAALSLPTLAWVIWAAQPPRKDKDGKRRNPDGSEWQPGDCGLV
jgi:hypothetical protein